MNEGFATYLEARFSAYKGWMAWSKWQQEFTQNDGYWRTLYGPPGNYKKKDFGEINVRFCTARMLVRLRDTIGPVKFADVLRAWPQEEADSNRTRGGYIAWVNARTGRDLTDFFHTWLMSRTAPQ
jgi:aminopeptidase N